MLAGRRRIGPDGELIPMAEQDRRLWIADEIAEGVGLITDALPRGPTGPYQLQAAIAALHDEAPSAEATDWPQILALYEVLLGLSDNPVVALNHAVAVAMVADRRRGWTCSDSSRPTSGSPRTDGSTPCGPTCWRWPAIAPPRATPISRQPVGPPAFSTSDTSTRGCPPDRRALTATAPDGPPSGAMSG